jgi:Mg2+/citrate symporter
MKTNIHFLYIAHFFLEWEMFQTKVVGKMKTHILCSVTFFFRILPLLWDSVEKYGRDRQATDSNIIQRMRIACWMTKATDTHSEYVILISFPRQQWLRERAWILCYAYIVVLYVKTRCCVELLPCWFVKRKGGKYMKSRTDRVVDGNTNVLPPPQRFLAQI